MTTKSKRKAKQKAGRASAEARRRKPAPAAWDHGADGPANRRGLVVEDRGETDPATGKTINPNGVTGARRVDPLECWRDRGFISQEGYAAAVALREAFEATFKAPPALPENHKVEASPKPDQAVDIQIERLSRFRTAMARVADQDRRIVSACVLHGEHPAHIYGALRAADGFAHLREALDRLAAATGGRPRAQVRPLGYMGSQEREKADQRRKNGGG